MNKFILILVFLPPVLSMAQGSRLKYADRMYNDMAYVEAASGYEDVIERGIDSLSICNKIAASYDRSGDTKKAIEWYNFIERKNTITKDQLMRSILLYREIGDYKGSQQRALSYKEKFGTNDVINRIIEENASIVKLQESKENFSLSSQPINTINSEFGVAYLNNEQVFVSSNKRTSMLVKRVDGNDDCTFYNLYTADIDEKGNLRKLKKLKGINSKFNDGPAAFDKNSNLVFFTSNNMNDRRNKKRTDELEISRVKIYSGKIVGGKIKEIKELPFNSSNYSCAHPTISTDGKTMYFSSDMPGGYGGADIYKVTINQDGTFGTPTNMGSKINTELNEYFPYIHPSENLLFFSSDGHPGLGGLDVFVAKLSKEDVPKSIENLGAPINSESDDFSFVSNEAQKMGYLTSKRTGGKGSDDIYSFNQKTAIKNTPAVFGTVKNLLAGNTLEGVMIDVIDKSGNVIESVYSKNDGTYELDLGDFHDDFTIKASKDGFVVDQRDVEFSVEINDFYENITLLPVLDYYTFGLLKDLDTDKPIEGVAVSMIDKKTNTVISTTLSDANGTVKIMLPEKYKYNESADIEIKYQKPGYITLTSELSEKLGTKAGVSFNKDGLIAMKSGDNVDLNLLINIKPIYFDFNSAEIRIDKATTSELDKVVRILMENPTIKIEIRSHTDSRGKAEYNEWLSEERAKNSVSYIISKGVSANRITGKGYGETRLKVSDQKIKKAKSPEEKIKLHQLNRRTEFIILNNPQ